MPQRFANDDLLDAELGEKNDDKQNSNFKFLNKESVPRDKPLRTIGENLLQHSFFFILLLQSDNELPMTEMQKTCFRNKTRGKLPQF